MGYASNRHGNVLGGYLDLPYVNARWDNLIAGWRLDEVSRGAAAVSRADVLGTYTLTDNNTTGSAAYGPTGTVATFTTANTEYLTNASAYDFSTTWTYVTWVKVDGTAWYRGVCRLGHNGNRIYFNTGTLQLVVEIAGFTPTGWNPTLDAGWHMLALYHDNADDTCGFSVDGMNWITYSPRDLASDGAMTIGATTQAGANSFNGNISRTGLFNSVLTNANLAALFNSGTGLAYSGLGALASSAVGYWDLDEASGNRADDSGNGLTLSDNGTVTSATATPTALSRSAASFVAANSESLSHTNGVDFAILSGGGVRTIALWYKPTTLPAYSVLADNYQGVNGDFSFYAESSGAVTFYSTSTVAASGGPVTVGSWFFLVAWYDDATGKVYATINDAAAPAGAAAILPASAGAIQEIRIGARAGGSLFTDGLIDEVYIFSDVKDADWRARMYNAGAGRRYPN